MHTKDPWQASPPEPNTGVVTISGGRNGGKTIAYVNHDTLMSREEYEANIRLIKAAPELLEALQALNEACIFNGQLERATRAPNYHITDRAQAVIASALGQEAVV